MANATAPWNIGCKISGAFGTTASDRISGTARTIDTIDAGTTSFCRTIACAQAASRAGLCQRRFSAPIASASHMPSTASERTATPIAQPKYTDCTRNSEPSNATSQSAASGTLRRETWAKTGGSMWSCAWAKQKREITIRAGASVLPTITATARFSTTVTHFGATRLISPGAVARLPLPALISPVTAHHGAAWNNADATTENSTSATAQP